jgi:hypothetical protein
MFCLGLVGHRLISGRRRGIDYCCCFGMVTDLNLNHLLISQSLEIARKFALQPVLLAPHILEEARRWPRVGFVGIASLIVVVDCSFSLVLSLLFCNDSVSRLLSSS